MRRIRTVEVVLIAVLSHLWQQAANASWLGIHLKKQPAATIVWPTNNATVSDTVTVVVNVTNDLCLESLTLIVDGNDWFTLTHGPMAFTLPSNYFTNGVHTISVRAYGYSGQVAGNIDSPKELRSPPVFLNFRNPVVIDWAPAFGTHLPIRASLVYTQADWTIHIRKEDGTTVRNLTGVTTNGKIDEVWDGKDDHSNDVPADVVYFVKLTVTPPGDSKGSEGFTSSTNDTQVLPPVKPRPDPPWCRSR
jgi:Bacterial Ig domain